MGHKTYFDKASYLKSYQESIENPKSFWAKQAEEFVTWFQPWQSVLAGDFLTADVRWFQGAKLNVCYNCIDRHLPKRSDEIAIIWESDDPAKSLAITYRELHQQVCQFANVLKNQGVKKGDRVCIYLPMIPQAAIAMLACARIGAVHSAVFAGFSAEALRGRILDADCRLVITADESVRGGKYISLKNNTDIALVECPQVQHVIVIKNTGKQIDWNPQRDVWYHQAMTDASVDCPVEMMDAMDPLFILYTSGSTGKPKGVLQVSGGYLVYVAMTFKYVFNYHEHDIFWCTADIGWVTGHSYVVYGPLANGATTLMFEGVPTYPDISRFWQIIDKHQVNIFYTAPTAIRALMREGEAAVKKTSRKSLKLLGTVGEPINPEAWHWYHRVVGDNRCPIVDTWWQTETGGIMLVTLPGVDEPKAGSVGKPFFGIAPAIIDEQGKTILDTKTGDLVITRPWPGMLNTIYGNHIRFIEAYFKPAPNCYFTGDGAHRDSAGDYWIMGRIDDVLNVSGHRLGTAEIENALTEHSAVAEAAVIGFAHDIKGQGIYAYVIAKTGIETTVELTEELKLQVRQSIGSIAIPDNIQWVNALPKTRSGKIMRRILRKIVNGELESIGDTSTLADPEVVAELIKKK